MAHYKYVMLSGTGRSGTNITKEILSRHSRVASLPFEYRFIIDPEGIIDFYNSFSMTWSPYMSDNRIRRLENFLMNLATKGGPNYQKWELNEWLPGYDKHVSNLISALKDFQYQGYWPGAKCDGGRCQVYFSIYKNKEVLSSILGGFIDQIVKDFLYEKGKDCFVEDNTWNILFAEELFELLPEAKLIHVIRDPRDVIASFMHQKWCPDNFENALMMYKSIITRWFEVKKKIDSSNYLECKLENLVSNPSSVLESISDFVGLNFEKSLLKTDLRQSHQGRWRTEFCSKYKNVLNSELNDIIKFLGYD